MVTVDIAEAFASVPYITFLDHVGEQHLPAHFWHGIQYVSGVTIIVPNGLTFPIKRGVKQGDPVSLLLFNIAIV